MEKFDKITIAVRITRETRKKLEELRKELKMPYGVIFDTLVASAKINKYNDKPNWHVKE